MEFSIVIPTHDVHMSNNVQNVSIRNPHDGNVIIEKSEMRCKLKIPVLMQNENV